MEKKGANDGAVPGDPVTLPFISVSCPQQIAAHPQYEMARFLRIEKVGVGMASSVYLAVDAISKIKVALKVYDRRKLTRPLLAGVMAEIAIQGRLVHPHILALYAAFEDGNYLCIIMDFAGEGDLYKRLPGIRREEHAVAKYLIAPLLSALACLHHQNIIHRDLKPENMLLKASHLFLSDFGFAINHGKTRPVTRLGTMHFMAPELILEDPSDTDSLARDKVPRAHRRTYGPGVDVWAVGAITYETLLHRPPFDGPKEEDVVKEILENKPKYPTTLSDTARDFLEKCLAYNAEERPTAAELYEHPFVCKSMQKSRWMALHPNNFITIELARSSISEKELVPKPETWAGSAKVARPQKRDSLGFGEKEEGGEEEPPSRPFRERRRAMHSQSGLPDASQPPGSSPRGTNLRGTGSPCDSPGRPPRTIRITSRRYTATGGVDSPARDLAKHSRHGPAADAGGGQSLAASMRKLAIANSHAVGVLDGSTTSSPGPSARRDRVGSDSSGPVGDSLIPVSRMARASSMKSFRRATDVSPARARPGNFKLVMSKVISKKKTEGQDL